MEAQRGWMTTETHTANQWPRWSWATDWAGLGAYWEGGLSAKGHYFWNGIQVEGNVLGALEREFIEVNQGLLHCKQILYYLSHQGSPSSLKLTPNPSSIPKSILQGVPLGVWVSLGSCASSCCQQGAIVGLAGRDSSGEKPGERTWVGSTEGARARPCPAQLLLQIRRC